MLEDVVRTGGWQRIFWTLAIAAGAHALVLVLRLLGRRATTARLRGSWYKARTAATLATSIGVFAVYFVALGIVLREFGVSLTAYFASASIVGLAVGFGSQGLVQDVVTGLTIVFADVFHVGDLVEIAGQTGIVRSVGIRFTELVNVTGAQVFIPNRTIANVVNYESGFVRVFVDVRLPDDPERRAEFERRVRPLVEASFEQFSGILLKAPSVLGIERTSAGIDYLRVKFRVWPGQALLIETAFRQSVIHTLRAIDPGFADWMVVVHHRAEPKQRPDGRGLPRPAVLEE